MDEVAHALRFVGTEARQLRGGEFITDLRHVDAGAFAFVRFSATRAVHACGARQKSYGFNLVTPTNQAGRYQSRYLRAGQLNVVAPPGEWDQLIAGEGDESLAIVVDVEVLRRKAELLCGIDLEERLAAGAVLRPDHRAFAHLERFVRRLFRWVGHGRALLDRPESYQHIEQTCFRVLLAAITSAVPVGGKSPLQARNRFRLVRRSMDFMAAHLNRPLTVKDICAEADVSERTLQYAFQDFFGVSPMAYFKTRKLHAVRQTLKSAAPGGASVQEIAKRWNFSHTGNFAADYFRLFGELPSRTQGK